MKKNILVIFALISLSIVNAYSNGNINVNIPDSILYENAVKAIENGKFVIKANTLSYKQGRSGNVDSASNFIVWDTEKATIQVHPNNPGASDASPVLQEGKVSNLKQRYSKKGDVLLDAKVQNGPFIIKMNIRLKKGTNIAHVRVSSIGNNEDFTLVGTLIPGDITEVNAVPVIGVRRL